MNEKQSTKFNFDPSSPELRLFWKRAVSLGIVEEIVATFSPAGTLVTVTIDGKKHGALRAFQIIKTDERFQQVGSSRQDGQEKKKEKKKENKEEKEKKEPLVILPQRSITPLSTKHHLQLVGQRLNWNMVKGRLISQNFHVPDWDHDDLDGFFSHLTYTQQVTCLTEMRYRKQILESELHKDIRPFFAIYGEEDQEDIDVTRLDFTPGIRIFRPLSMATEEKGESEEEAEDAEPTESVGSGSLVSSSD